MSIKEAYNNWSESYDHSNNYTRELDQIATQKMLADLHFNTVLEIGCGTGKNTILLSKISKAVHAIDFSESMIKKAKEKTNSNNVKFTVTDITQKWPCEDLSIDFITCNLVLEHIRDLSFIFSEAYRSLGENRCFFVSELHPFRQYQGKKARFEQNGQTFEIQTFIHNITDFINAAKDNGFILREMNEWWHQEERSEPPRIVTFMFEKCTG
jgi:malonyl-CoA O-methyltransferase